MPPVHSNLFDLLAQLVPWGTQTVRNWVLSGTFLLIVLVVLVLVVGITFLFPQDSPDVTFTRRALIGVIVIVSVALVALVAIILCVIAAEARRYRTSTAE